MVPRTVRKRFAMGQDDGLVRAPGAWFAICAALAVAGAQGLASASEFVVAASGITAELHSAEEVTNRWLIRADGRLWFRHPTLGEIELLTGPDDPRLPRADIVSFIPLPEDVTAAAVREVAGITPRLAVDVFLLPAPPVGILGSFARRSALFLSPAFGEVQDVTVAALVAHELGHALTWAYLDRQPGRWDAYLRLRGLSTAASDPAAPHAERAREVLAEDIRYLFGGELARAGGSIENQDLLLPDAVPGLTNLLAGYFQGPPPPPGGAASLAFPNPARAQVTVEMTAPTAVDDVAPALGAAEAAAALAIYDLRGRLVRRVTGGEVANGRMMIGWDGRDGQGRPAASGRYLYAVTWGGRLSRGSILIAR